MDPATALHQPPQDAARYIFDQTQYALHHQGDSWSTPSQPPYHASMSDHSASHVPEPSSVSPKSANKQNNGKPSSPAASGRMTRTRAAALAKGSNHQLSSEEGDHLPAVSISSPYYNQFPSSTQQHVLRYFLPSPSLPASFSIPQYSPTSSSVLADHPAVLVAALLAVAVLFCLTRIFHPFLAVLSVSRTSLPLPHRRSSPRQCSRLLKFSPPIDRCLSIPATQLPNHQ